MRFEFYKILDKQYVDSFRSGNLYMNSLEYFRKIEGNEAQNDWAEGICGTVHKNQLRQIGFDFSEELQEVMGEKVTLSSNYFGLNNIFCLYRFLIDDERKLVWKPDKELQKFNDADTKVVVRITDTEEFLRRVDKAVEKNLKNQIMEYCIYGNIVYSNSWSHADGPGTRSAFHKEPSYSYQNEWRLCVLRNALDRGAFQFEIGDLSDITEEISLEQFLKHPEELYSDFAVASEGVPEEVDTFQISGKINTVNHLMFSYSGLPITKLERSDQAQADWHYSQYLKLSGNAGEIDSYLEKQMKKFSDFDHLELLVQHRLSEGAWVKSTDAFMYFINEVSDPIEKEPERFFSQIHSILMAHRQAADAAKMYIIASGKYNLQKEVKTIILSDILFALGFYDKAISVFEEMKQTNKDPVLEYDLAVSYLFTLDFVQADEHLKEYETYFSHSTEVAKKVTQLRLLINCFLKEEPLQIEPVISRYDGFEWTEEFENVLKMTGKKKIHLGIDALYKIEKAGKWDLLEKFVSVDICPLTISEIIHAYEQSGDEKLFYIVIHAARLPQLNMVSPDLEYYLTLNHMKEDFPEFMKMERALYLQEVQADQKEEQREEAK